MKIEQNGAVTTVTFDVSAGWEQCLFLRSDAHHDSILCDREVEKRHLDKAKNLNALIIDAGDTFDLMQSRNDRRRSADEIRPEYVTDSYFDAVINDAIRFYAPYASNFLLLARGNHEDAVIQYSGTDPIGRLAHGLDLAGGHVCRGQAGGYIRFMFQASGVPQGSVVYRYHHSGGSGGAAPVTKGVIQTARQSAYVVDADIVHNGHTHTAYHVPQPRERLNNKGMITYDLLHYVRTPGYKRQGRWEQQKGMAPTALGGALVRLSWQNHRPAVDVMMVLEA